MGSSLRETSQTDHSFYSEHGPHLGKWRWDRFKIRIEDAAELIASPKIRKWFFLDEAPNDLWDAYHWSEPHAPV